MMLNLTLSCIAYVPRKLDLGNEGSRDAGRRVCLRRCTTMLVLTDVFAT